MEQTTETLPQGAKTSDLDKVIAESTAKLEEAQAPKRGRGRPMGWRKNPQNANPSGQVPPGTQGGSAVYEGQVVKINEIEPLASEIVKAPFDLIGWKSGVDLTPTDAESATPSKYLSKLIECYLPDLESKDPKVFAWVAFAISYALLGVKKLRVFLSKKPKDGKNEQQEIVTNDKGEQVAKPAEKVLPTETILASEHFRRTFP